jgi:hypothetical protein
MESLKWSLRFGLPDQSVCTSMFVVSPKSCTCPTHPILLDFITRIIFGEEQAYQSRKS